MKVSMINNCSYCFKSYREAGRKLGITDEEFAQLEDIEGGDFTPAERS